MEVHHHGIDIIRRPAVMVDDADLGNCLQQRLAFHLAGPVRIHHHQGTAVVAHQQRVLTGNKDVPVFGNLPNLVHQPLGGIVFQIQNDIRFFPFLPAQTVHTHGGTHRVQIRVLVSHDEHLAALVDQLRHGIGHHPGTNLAAVIRFLGTPAVEGEVEAIFDHRLIAAPAQRHFNRQRREFVALIIRRSIHAQAKGNRRANSCRIRHLMDLLQQRELILNGLIQSALFKNKQEPVPFQLAKQSLIAFRPLGDGIIELGVHGGNRAVSQILGQLVIVVHQDDGHHRSGTDVLVPYLIQFRQIRKIQNAQHGSVPVVSPDGGTVHPIPAVSHGNIIGILRFSAHQPIRGEIGQNFRQLLIQHPILEAGDGLELFVCPDDTPVPQPCQHHGKGAFLPIRFLQGAGCGLNKRLQFPPAVILLNPINDKQDSRNTKFYRRQQIPFRQGGRNGEANHHRKIQSHVGLNQPAQFLVHPSHLLKEYSNP